MNKYGAKKVQADGHTFDSKAEHRRYCELMTLVNAGEIEALELQPRYELVVCGVKIGRYTGDFRYLDRRTGEQIVEDVKGVKTRDYVLRRKLMKAIHGIDVVEIGR